MTHADLLPYVSAKPIETWTLASRIFSPNAYPVVRSCSIVPVTAKEALRLKEWFPIVWKRRSDCGYQLVAVRTLVPSGVAMSPEAYQSLHALPLVCLAYPFTFDPTKDITEKSPRWIDATTPDNPTDIGAPITFENGQPTMATMLRYHALDRFAEDWTRTVAMTSALSEGENFERWNVMFNVGQSKVGYDDLYVVRPSAFAGPQLAGLVRDFGVSAANLLADHRLSLFRTSSLLRMATLRLSQNPTVSKSGVP